MTIYNSVKELVGNTPLLKIDKRTHGLKNVNLYAKLEYYNPYGSLKDRPANNMLKDHIKVLKKTNKTVLEASSGNTAKALCGLSSKEGLSFKTITNRIKQPEVRKILQIMGAKIQELPGLSDCPDPNDPNDFTTVATNLEKSHPKKYFYTDQYFNELNWQSHHEGTGKELAKDLNQLDFFIGTLGTCGSTYGAGKYLKKNRNTKIIGAIAEAGQSIPGGRNATELWEVGIFKKEFYESIESISTTDAVKSMKNLIQKEGVLGGPTTGLNYQASINYLKKIDEKLTKPINAVFIACDRFEWYLSYIEQHAPEIFDSKEENKKTIDSQSIQQITQSPTLTPKEVTEMQTKKELTIIDIRGKFAYNRGHLPTSQHIIAEVLEKIIEEGKSFSNNSIIVITCTKGIISKKFASFLQTQGYEAYSLEGGILNWKGQGYKLEQTE